MTRLGLLSLALRRWLPSYVRSRFRKKPRPVHILFCMVDHYEPGVGRASPGTQVDRVGQLVSAFPRLADRHQDSNGNRPRRTWFFPPHDHRYGNLKSLVSLCARGYGEIELHLHHGKSRPDTSENLERTLRLCVREYSRFGIFGADGGGKRYGFIHGDWALANSRKDGSYCGVGDELHILGKTGCYADFTFPSCNECNPTQINSIYYVNEASSKPRGHARGIVAAKGKAPAGEMLLIQGPLHPFFVRPSLFGLRPFGDDITDGKPATERRIDCWVNTWIHIAGCPEWLILKVHAHGAWDVDATLGDGMDHALGYLESRYNDGSNFRLHYVTARELYNVIKAAEAGESGDPEQFRNYLIQPPRYDASPEILEASEELRQAVYSTYCD